MARPEARPLLLSTFLCLLLTGVSVVLALLLWRQLGHTEEEIAKIQRIANACVAPRKAPKTRARPAPPQDRVQRERPYLGHEGVDISPAMRVRLEYLDEASELQSSRVGDPQLLPPSTIHVVNLWAVWCGACKEEMPDFQRLFAERSSDWGESVRFVAVQVNDLSAPKHAYASWASSMPANPLRLSDRGKGAPFLQALRGAQGRQPLFFDKLPVTLVLDCNRRVRWAKFERLVDGDIRDLERHVDTLRAELLEEGADAHCRQVWCGNGRCEDGEGVAKNHCVEDCGDYIARPPRAVEVLPVPVPVPAAALPAAADATHPPCPPSWVRSANGECVPKLRKAIRPDATSPIPAERVVASRCGDGLCDPGGGEDSQSCCLDCGCLGSFECRLGAGDRESCLPGLKP